MFPFLTPYILAIKIGLIVLAVGSLVGAGIWFRGVLAERDTLKTQKALAEATTKMYADAWNRNDQLQRGIVDEIRKIRVQTNNYITAIDSSPAPKVADGVTFQLVSPGLPQTYTLPSLPQFANNTSSRTSSTLTRH